MKVAVVFTVWLVANQKFGKGEQLDPIEAYHFYKKNVFLNYLIMIFLFIPNLTKLRKN